MKRWISKSNAFWSTCTVSAIMLVVVACGGGGGGGGSTNSGGSNCGSGPSRIVREDTFCGIANVVIRILNGSNSVIASATTSQTGEFTLIMPAGAVKMHISNASIPSGYYKQYTYSGLRYATTVSTCGAPVPAHTVGQPLVLPSQIIITPQNFPPPPPPNGCS